MSEAYECDRCGARTVPGSALCRTCIEKMLKELPSTLTLPDLPKLPMPTLSASPPESCHLCFGSGEGPFGDCPECAGSGIQHPYKS